MTQEMVRATSNVMVGTLQINSLRVHVLFDPSATHSFISTRFVTKLRKEVQRIEKRFVIRTLLGNKVETNNMYVGVGVSLARYETEVDLI
jgi:hypothetical protein